jgi:hypothetical protein
MSRTTHHDAQEGPTLAAEDHLHSVPYWKRAHHDWRFWIAVFFIFAAIGIYVATVDLSLVPNAYRRHTLTRTP